MTEVMDITDLKESTTQQLNINTEGANIKTEVDTVKVKVVITERKE